MRILVVEDDHIISDGLRAGLAMSGATVDCVATCADADAALAASRFGAVVLDLMLPDGSGLDLAFDAGNATGIFKMTAGASC